MRKVGPAGGDLVGQLAKRFRDLGGIVVLRPCVSHDPPPVCIRQSHRFRLVDLGDPATARISNNSTTMLENAERTHFNSPLCTSYSASTLFSKALYSSGSLRITHQSKPSSSRRPDLLGHIIRIDLPQPFPRALNGTLESLGQPGDVDRVEGAVECACEVFEVECLHDGMSERRDREADAVNE